jgi:hypothetical protein
VTTRNNSASTIYRISPGVASPYPNLSISSCGEITAPGFYTVTAHLNQTQPGADCLRVHDTHDVHIECAGRNVLGGRSAIVVGNVDGFSIRNCRMDIAPGGGDVLQVLNSTHGLISGNRVGHLGNVRLTNWFDEVRDTTFSGNTVYGELRQRYSWRNAIVNNQMTYTNATAGYSGWAMIHSWRGGNHQIESNVIDCQGVSGDAGTRTGIKLDDEVGNIIGKNTIRNAANAGIETEGILRDLTISGNNIVNARYAGIGTLGWVSWFGISIVNNTVSLSPRMFNIYTGIEGPPPAPYVAFEQNTFSGNRFINPKTGSAYSAYLRVFTHPYFRVANNQFRNNDFGKVRQAPFFVLPVEPGAIVDGGGNICATQPAGYPLACR